MMSATAEDEVVRAPPQPRSPLPDEPFFAPAVVDGIDRDDIMPLPPPAKDPVSDLFTSLSSRMSDAVRSVHRSLPTTSSTAAALPALLLFGDSLTERGSAITDDGGPGWISLLAEMYAGKADLLVRGFSGYNSRWGLHVFPRIVASLPGGIGNVKVALIFFGANDACVEEQGQCVPLKEYVANLRKLANYVRALRRSDPVIPVLVAPPPVQEDREGPMPARLAARTQEYAAACVTLGKELACPVVDVHDEVMRRVRSECEEEEEEAWQKALGKYLCDGLHFTAEGNAVVAEAVLETCKRELPNIAPDALQRPFPQWIDIDHENPRESLGTSNLV